MVENVEGTDIASGLAGCTKNPESRTIILICTAFFGGISIRVFVS